MTQNIDDIRRCQGHSIIGERASSRRIPEHSTRGAIDRPRAIPCDDRIAIGIKQRNEFQLG